MKIQPRGTNLHTWATALACPQGRLPFVTSSMPKSTTTKRSRRKLDRRKRCALLYVHLDEGHSMRHRVRGSWLCTEKNAKSLTLWFSPTQLAERRKPAAACATSERVAGTWSPRTTAACAVKASRVGTIPASSRDDAITVTSFQRLFGGFSKHRSVGESWAGTDIKASQLLQEVGTAWMGARCAPLHATAVASSRHSSRGGAHRRPAGLTKG
jgi:hypothetical protein